MGFAPFCEKCELGIYKFHDTKESSAMMPFPTIVSDRDPAGVGKAATVGKGSFVVLHITAECGGVAVLF